MPLDTTDCTGFICMPQRPFYWFVKNHGIHTVKIPFEFSHQCHIFLIRVQMTTRCHIFVIRVETTTRL